MRLWNLFGVPAPEFYWFHFRVVDGVEEAPATANGQYDGDFWGMFMALEDYDGAFLDHQNLERPGPGTAGGCSAIRGRRRRR